MYVDNFKYYSFESDTSGDNAYISFVARLPMSFPGSGLFQDQELRRVTFFVDQGNLMLAQSPLLEASKKIGHTYTIPLAPDVSLFDMEFYDGVANKWYAEWISTNQLPRMVRVALAFGKQNQNVRRPESMTIRSVLLGGIAITRAGAGLMGGAGMGMVPALRNPQFRGGPQLKEDPFCGRELPESFRSGAHFGNKSRSQLFPE
jgi:hypothetical protein